eukprot:m.1102524 g.1102524  ORF g.1102524 m.1102524 type:complete len:199 (-) comp24326_c0_seq86:227-823(-)
MFCAGVYQSGCRDDGLMFISCSTICRNWCTSCIANVNFCSVDLILSTATGNPGRTYKFLDTSVISPVWPFGHGLSYTSFALEVVQGPGPSALAPGEASQWVVSISNTGNVPGGIAVICYVSATNQTVIPDPPHRWVFDFARAPVLHPGEHVLLPFTLTARGRALTDRSGQWVVPTGGYTVQCEAGGVAATTPYRFSVA